MRRLATEQEKKIDVITAYVEKFATIENRIVTPQLYSVYVEALVGLTLQQIEKGLKKCLQQSTRWPWPGQVREFCEDEI